MIYAITYTWKKSYNLAKMLNKSLKSLGILHTVVIDEDCEWFPADDATTLLKKNYHGGRGWEDCMQKLQGYKWVMERFNIQKDDWLMDMDDDTYMADDEWIKLLTPDYDLAGIQHDIPFKTHFGDFAHMSGACLCMRGSFVRKILSPSTIDWFHVRAELLQYKLPFVWDLVISYGLISLGARTLNINKILDLTVDPQEHFAGKAKGHFFHFNTVYKSFMGLPTPGGRYDIPKVLEQLNIEV